MHLIPGELTLLDGQWVPVGEVQALPDDGPWRIVVRNGHLVPADAPASTLDPNAGMIENDRAAIARTVPPPVREPKPAPRVLHWTERSPDLSATSHQVDPSYVLAASRFDA